MKSLIDKFVNGVKTDVRGTIIKTICYTLQVVGDAIADGLYFVFIVLLLPLPVRTLTRVKHKLSPTKKLDYAHSDIRLQADSMLDFYRARACEKERETVNWIETYFEQGDVFFDVGANIGAYSLVACAYCGGNVTILAFEPSFSNYHQLCRNIIVNKFQKSITPYMIALAESPGLLSFNYQSLEAGSADHWLGDDLSEEAERYVYTQQILVFSVDYLVDKFRFPFPNHIKLDVDGTEVGVLRGAEKTLQNNNLKSILVEVRDVDGISDQVNGILVSAGFHLTSKTDRGDGITWNCVYAR
jgi:FkbM family methyltransferase